MRVLGNAVAMFEADKSEIFRFSGLLLILLLVWLIISIIMLFYLQLNFVVLT